MRKEDNLVLLNPRSIIKGIFSAKNLRIPYLFHEILTEFKGFVIFQFKG